MKSIMILPVLKKTLEKNNYKIKDYKEGVLLFTTPDENLGVWIYLDYAQISGSIVFYAPIYNNMSIEDKEWFNSQTNENGYILDDFGALHSENGHIIWKAVLDAETILTSDDTEDSLKEIYEAVVEMVKEREEWVTQNIKGNRMKNEKNNQIVTLLRTALKKNNYSYWLSDKKTIAFATPDYSLRRIIEIDFGQSDEYVEFTTEFIKWGFLCRGKDEETLRFKSHTDKNGRIYDNLGVMYITNDSIVWSYKLNIKNIRLSRDSNIFLKDLFENVVETVNERLTWLEENVSLYGLLHLELPTSLNNFDDIPLADQIVWMRDNMQKLIELGMTERGIPGYIGGYNCSCKNYDERLNCKALVFTIERDLSDEDYGRVVVAILHPKEPSDLSTCLMRGNRTKILDFLQSDDSLVELEEEIQGLSDAMKKYL